MRSESEPAVFPVSVPLCESAAGRIYLEFILITVKPDSTLIDRSPIIPVCMYADVVRTSPIDTVQCHGGSFLDCHAIGRSWIAGRSLYGIS